eukprot:Clim_evm8s219 gene=Clim_evmTU8s219
MSFPETYQTHSVAELTARFHAFQEEQQSTNTTYSEKGIVTGADYWEHLVDTYGDAMAVTSVHHARETEPNASIQGPFRYCDLDKRANQVANYVLKRGDLPPRSRVAVMVHNCPLFYAVILGLAKVGVEAALVNTNLREDLLHATLDTADAQLVMAMDRYTEPLMEALGRDPKLAREEVCWLNELDLDSSPMTESSKNMNQIFGQMSMKRPDRVHRSVIQTREPMFYIFTSGTTGRSKAAKFSHARWIGAGVGWSGPSSLVQGMNYYIPLPLYHGNALAVATSPAFKSGCCIVLREKFSASQFWNDIISYNCQAMVYIGELWRYVWLQKAKDSDIQNPLEIIVGNGLRPDIWEDVVSRFGISRIVEHYGSTEMPAGAVLNWTNKPGSCGFVPTQWRKDHGGDRIVKYDTATDSVMRNSAGRLILVGDNEAGELLMTLPEGKYDGYLTRNDTERKLYRDVFKEGDCYYSSGDILRIDNEGFYYFVDRAGDTFRWKGENVSTTEVAEAMAEVPGILEVNTYGVPVPNHDGKAGMASLLVDWLLQCPTETEGKSMQTAANGVPDASELGSRSSSVQHEFDLQTLYNVLKEKLPRYAMPIFLRLRDEEHSKTSTLKFQKHLYVKEGCDPRNPAITDHLYVADHSVEAYVPLTNQIYDNIVAHKLRV